MKIKNLKYTAVLFLFICLSACTQKNNQSQAVDYAQRSREYYLQAASEYQRLIKNSRNQSELYFQLGRLYYEHAEFEQAIGAFKKTRDPQALKFTGISYYRLGNFTDALEAFDKYSGNEEEALYYYALTCEKLNLFDKALGIYAKIKNGVFQNKAAKRISEIEKRPGQPHIKTLSPQTYNVLKNAPPASAYPQAGALILSCDETVEITGDYKEIAELHYIIKILNERGKEDFSEAHIDYDSTYEKLELEYARTIKPDGSVVDIGARHMRDVSKYLNYPLYSNARVFIISFPEISEGAVIEYKARIHRSQLVNQRDFSLYYPLQAAEPVIAASFRVIVPEATKLNLKVLNSRYNSFSASLQPQVTKIEKAVLYQWQFKDIPQIIPEPSMPPLSEINTSVAISTFDNWSQIYKWWYAMAKDKILPDEPIKDKIHQLCKGAGSDEDKARAIYNFCAQNIRYVAVEYGDAGYQPHPARDIFRNKYGDCKDQAVLLVTMLKEAGLVSWPVLIPTRDNYNLDKDFASLPFNHCIAAVLLNDKIIFLDPTAETCSFGDLPSADQGRNVLICKDDGYSIEATPVYDSRHNLNRQSLDIEINNQEGIRAEKSVFTYGTYDQLQRYWLLYTPPELIKQTLQEKIQDISIGAQLTGYKIDNLKDLNREVVLKYSLVGPEYFTDAGILRIMPQLAGVDTSLVAKDKRVYPVDLGTPDAREINLNIRLPENFVVKYMPGDVVEDSPWLSYSAEYRYNGKILSFKQRTELKNSTISQQEYSVFKGFFEGLAKKLKQRVILERIEH